MSRNEIISSIGFPVLAQQGGNGAFIAVAAGEPQAAPDRQPAVNSRSLRRGKPPGAL